ncbi:unnamed protein product [Notodromas monacha]|uniref:Uncharacterized protein n=1 Tax=Notodromas monacha TaxID=399045 RepID=A0A7R9BH93_9CRUS|nr:unnamed protein product [Notodromas monacha]CAG0914635.1 unnamed protein product [Notodromas monacha]
MSLSSSSGCPACAGRFPFFKWKVGRRLMLRHSCWHCKVDFCDGCLVKEGKLRWCEACRVLVRTPHNRAAVQRLPVHCLRAFLERKHVSTRGCAEKKELVDLIYNHFGQRYEHELRSDGIRVYAADAVVADEQVSGDDDNSPSIDGNTMNDCFALPSDVANPVTETGLDATAVSALVRTDSAANPDSTSLSESRRLRRFPSVSDLETEEDVGGLSVRECKELLALYRVDFRGACEKFELVERVRELWRDRQAAKAEADQLAEEDLCKVCMDARIDCVLLECGHMTTCTLCGKKMNECPICRQFVIRAVSIIVSGTCTEPNMSPRFTCVNCLEDMKVARHVLCAECPEHHLCIPCFIHGAEPGKHKNTHAYRVIDDGMLPVFEAPCARETAAEGEEEDRTDWMGWEEIRLLKAMEQYQYGNWKDVAAVLQTRSPEECEAHYVHCYINGNLGTATWGVVREACSDLGVVDHTAPSTEVVMDESDMTALPLATINDQDALALGFLRRRQDFELEYNNDAEKLISNLQFDPMDDDLEKQLKLVKVDMYYRQLVERNTRKRVALEYRLVESFCAKNPSKIGMGPSMTPASAPTANSAGAQFSSKSLQPLKKKWLLKEGENAKKLRPLSRLLTAKLMDILLPSLLQEEILRCRMQEVAKYRALGFRTFDECYGFEADSLRATRKRSASVSEQQAPARLLGRGPPASASKADGQICTSAATLSPLSSPSSSPPPAQLHHASKRKKFMVDGGKHLRNICFDVPKEESMVAAGAGKLSPSVMGADETGMIASVAGEIKGCSWDFQAAYLRFLDARISAGTSASADSRRRTRSTRQPCSLRGGQGSSLVRFCVYPRPCVAKSATGRAKQVGSGGRGRSTSTATQKCQEMMPVLGKESRNDLVRGLVNDGGDDLRELKEAGRDNDEESCWVSKVVGDSHLLWMPRLVKPASSVARLTWSNASYNAAIECAALRRAMLQG